MKLTGRLSVQIRPVPLKTLWHSSFNLVEHPAVQLSFLRYDKVCKNDQKLRWLCVASMVK